MADHRKPTPEELEASIKAAEEAIENLDKEETPAETPSEEIPEEKEEEDVEEVEEETPSEEIPEEKEEETVEKRYKEASKEGQKLNEDRKLIDKALHEARNIADPTDDELRQEYPSWDELDDTTRKIAKDNLINKRRFEKLDQADEQRRVVEEWNEKIDTQLDDPKFLLHHSDLEGKTEEFAIYAKDKSRRNISLEILVSAFLHDNASGKVKHKGKMFETGTGGSKEKMKPKDDSLSADEGRALMKTNYKKYKQLLVAGKIKNE